MIKSAPREDNITHPTLVSLLRMRADQQPSRLAYMFTSDGGSGTEEVTYAELDKRAGAIACMLSDLRMRGKRAMLLYPSGIDYIAAFFGCLYVGAIAVPACPPDPLRLDRSLPRLVSVARDAMPSAVLTTAALGATLPLLFRASPELSRLHVMVTDDASDEYGRGWEPVPADAGSIALLQYTSGSTSAPKGVVLTHQNLMSNSELIYRLFRHSPESRGVTWLPLHHDMGLIGGVVQPLYGGFPVTLIPPVDFLRRPLSWLQEISRTRATTSGGPNFAFDLCVTKTTAEERSRLDLSNWRVAFNGSEPVRAETMENFARAFSSVGFRPEAFHPCYGLAEGTLIVTGGLPWSRRGTESFDAAALRYGVAVPDAAISGPPVTGSRRLVSSGFAADERGVVIVDPGTGAERPAGQIGEIWILGRSVARSYWHRPKETRETFGARLARTGEGPFLRSGDLGFIVGGRLFVTGRIKDLIIIRGRNHYPQDIEVTAERSSALLRRGCAAAFTVADGGGQRLVVAHEVRREVGDVNVGEVADAIRAAVAAEHEIQVHTVVLLPPGGIPKTSSGKVQRGLCAAMFTDGRLAELGRSTISRLALGCRLRLDRSSLMALGIDSSAVINIQHSIRADLGAQVTAADLARAVSIADLAVRLDERISAEAAASPIEAVPPASSPDLAVPDKNVVRHYYWASGSRVPVHAVLDPDSVVHPGGLRREAGNRAGRR